MLACDPLPFYFTGWSHAYHCPDFVDAEFCSAMPDLDISLNYATLRLACSPDHV